MDYEVTAADRAALPDAYRREQRHCGYREGDRALPYAGFFAERTRPVQVEVRDVLNRAGGRSEADGYEVGEAVDRLARPGDEPLENGWTRTGRGTLFVAVRTAMPGVTAAMWDWWFGWHGSVSARYKLWHPDAHLFVAWGEDRSADRTLTDRQRYVRNVSYVDEYIGSARQRLAIRFLDPATLGFAERPGTLHVCARVGVSWAPVAIGWLVHQLRPTGDGCEMRSRFFLADVAVLDLPRRALPAGPRGAVFASRPASLVTRAVAPRVVGRVMPRSTGHDMFEHCAAEMNHLAGFLPALHEQFRDTP